MKKSILIAAISLSAGLTSEKLFAQTQQRDTAKSTTTTTTKSTSSTSGSITAPTSDIVTTIDGNIDYSTLAVALKAANLETTLKGKGPFTVFAPNNVAFSNIPKSKLDSLLKDPVKLAAVLKGHVVTGNYDKASVIKALSAGKGTAILKTVEGQTLTLSVNDKKNLELTDSQGNKALVTSFNMMGTNGVAHGINAVLTR